MSLEIIQDVLLEPVSLSVVKDFCRIDQDYTAEDDVLTILMKSAREVIEGATNLSLAPKKYLLTTCDRYVVLPYGIHTDITKIVHNGDDLIPDDYKIYGGRFKSIGIGTRGLHFFYPIDGSFPIIEPIGTTYMDGNFEIYFDAGYNTDDLPQGLRHLILRLTDYYYANRGQSVGAMPKDIAGEVARYSRLPIL